MGFMPELKWNVCGWTESVADDRGLRFVPDRVRESFDGLDLVIVPGGFATRQLMHDAEFMNWFHGIEVVPLKASVCTGSLLLGAAGFLKAMPATSHHSALPDLAPLR